MKILFLVPYPLAQAPSQRFRFEQYFTILKKAGHQIQTQSFLSEHNWKLFYKEGEPIKKILALIWGFLKRTYALFIVPGFDFIFIHREAAPVGPPVFEWLIANVFRKKIIYDFDDAIWLTDRTDETLLLRALKWRSKVKSICQWSHKVSCGNRYLQQYARQFNAKAIYNPTTLNMEEIEKQFGVGTNQNSNNVTIGWTGSHSTLKYLETLKPVLQIIENEFQQVSCIVIADRPPALDLHRLTYIPWSAQNEIGDLLKIDIGIMPLPDDEWTKGKCGFKALQYMALEIPAVVSNVGANADIISQGVEGFLCTTPEEWLVALRTLITQADLRTSMGKSGRTKLTNHYSVSSNSGNFLSFFL
jgi:glycosyltransferase involved in cell wall biosynthesis